MIKKMLIMLGLAFTVLLLSCGGPLKEKDTKGTAESAIGGDEGISFRFMDIVDDRFYTNGQLRVGIELDNKGACDIGTKSGDGGDDFECFGLIKLSGLDEDIFEYGDSSIVMYDRTWYNPNNIKSRKGKDGNFYEIGRNAFLPARSRDHPKGGKEIITFPPIKATLNKNIPEHKTTLVATACYQYKTKASIPVCIDPLKYEDVLGDKVCEVQDISLKSQGAPVAVTRVEPEVFTNEKDNKVIPMMYFRIYIKNIGKGEIYDPTPNDNPYSESLPENSPLKNMNTHESCPAIPYTHQNIIRINSVSLGGSGANTIKLTCQPGVKNIDGLGGRLHLYDDEGLIICQTETNSGNGLGYQTYMTNLYIELEYGYTHSIKKEITVLRVPGIQTTDIPAVS